MFRPDKGDRQGVANVLVLVTDGRSQNQEQTWREAMDARKDGISIVTIGIGSGVDEQELQVRPYSDVHYIDVIMGTMAFKSPA